MDTVGNRKRSGQGSTHHSPTCETQKISHRAVHGSLYQDERHEDRQKHVLKEYPKQALECYKLVDVYRDFRADTKLLEDNDEVPGKNDYQDNGNRVDRTNLPETVTDYRTDFDNDVEVEYKRPLKGPFMANKFQTETAGGSIKKYFEFFTVDDYMTNDTQVVYENYTSVISDQLSEGQWIQVRTAFSGKEALQATSSNSVTS